MPSGLEAEAPAHSAPRPVLSRAAVLLCNAGKIELETHGRGCCFEKGWGEEEKRWARSEEELQVRRAGERGLDLRPTAAPVATPH